MIGSIYFLFVAVSLLLLYVSPFLWPLIVLAQGGTLLTFYHKKWGFYLGTAALVTYVICDFERLCLQSFMFYFLGALFCSWLIESLQKREQESIEEKLSTTQSLLEREKLESDRWMKESAALDQRIQRLEAEKEGTVIHKDLSLEAEYALLQHQMQEVQQELEKKVELFSSLEEKYRTLETEFILSKKDREEDLFLREEGQCSQLAEITALPSSQEVEVEVLESLLKPATASKKNDSSPTEEKRGSSACFRSL